jgi:hypothetical protein
MLQPDKRPSLLRRALGVFVVFAFFLALFLWAGKALVQRPVERVYLDAQRLAALRTFERAIVPLKSLRDYKAPTAELIRKQFEFCVDPLKEQSRATASARARRTNSCANPSAAEELACHLRTINSRLNEMSGRKNRERALSERYVVDVDSWIDAIRTPAGQAVAKPAIESRGPGKQQAVACRDALAAAADLAAGEGKLLGLFAWRELSSKNVAAGQFAPGQALKVSSRILEQRNPWGGIPGCIYYGGTRQHGKVMFVTDKRQSNRQSCVAMRPRGTDEKDMTAVFLRATGAKPEGADAAPAPPESLEVILADLDNIRLPWKDLFRAYTEMSAETSAEPLAEESAEKSAAAIEVILPVSNGRYPVAVSHGPNQLDRQKHKVDAGFNIHLTIDPDSQRIVQQISKCYAGDTQSCQGIGLTSDKKFSDFTRLMYEKAAVRMAAVALIDIPTGRIEALGSAHTNCYHQEFDGPGRNAGECPDLPSTPHYEPDRLLNHALFTDALPGSIIKPIMATGFLRDLRYREKIVADRVSTGFIRLQDELKSSDSVAFLNRMFCIDKGWANCDRPRDIQQAALLFGWDSGCLEPSFRCGRLNVLFGYPDASRIRQDTARMPLGASVMFGRLLAEPASSKRSADFQLMRNFSFDPKLAAACSRGDFYSGTGTNRGWRKCKHGHLVYLESEGWGQGNARTTALGAAGMMARLAAAANGQASQRLPHLVDRISDSKAQKFDLAAHQFRLADPVKLEIPQQDAALIVQGMISHKAQGAPAGSRSGTAHAACARVFDAASCNRIDWVAGKTGTPPYGNDGLTLKEIRQKCRLAPSRNLAAGEQNEWWTSCSREQAYKWYVAVFKSDDGQSGFDKAVAVLSERNWYRTGPLAGKVQSPGDQDATNISAEMAFRIMARIRTGGIQVQAQSGGKS